jgi:hypothetical protein
MKLKTLFILVIVLGLISLAAYYASKDTENQTPDSLVDHPVLNRSVLEKVSQVTIKDQGKSVSLKLKDNNIWIVSDYFNFPADMSKLSSFVNDLTSAKIQRLVTVNPSRIERLEFKGSEIQLLDASGKYLFKLELGKTDEKGGRFIRYENEPKAYLANLSVWLDTNAKGWALNKLFNDKPESISKIDLSFETGSTLTLLRQKQDSLWASPDNPKQTVNVDKLNSLLTTLTELRFSETTETGNPLARDAKKHTETIKLTTFSGKSIVITLGRKPEIKTVKPVPLPSNLSKNVKDSSKSLEPEYNTTPAGPTYAWITTSDNSDSINSLSSLRDFQVDDYSYTSLPQKREDMFIPSSPKSTP